MVRLDPGRARRPVIGVETTDGTENVCLATRSARVLIFPVAEANVVAGAAKGVTAVKIDAKDAVIGFALANKMREGLTAKASGPTAGRPRSSGPPSIPSPAAAAGATGSCSAGRSSRSSRRTRCRSRRRSRWDDRISRS